MNYGERLRQIAYEAERREQALERLAFCFDVYLEYTRDGKQPTEHMDAVKATEQLEAAIRNAVGLPPDQSSPAQREADQRRRPA